MNREQLEEIRSEWERQNEWHLTSHGAWRCCSACTLADARVPALLDEIDRLEKLVVRLGRRTFIAEEVANTLAATVEAASTAEGSAEGGTSKDSGGAS